MKRSEQVNKKDKPKFTIKNKDLVKRIIFTLVVLLLVKIAMLITVPGVTLSDNYSEGANNIEFFKLLSTLGGGSINQFSILALGVSPYITASIITQLLSTDVVPILTNWSKSGERGRKKIDKLTKVLTIPFALMQTIATIFTLSQYGLIEPKWGDPSSIGGATFYFFLVPIIMLAGTFLMLWIADQITIKGIGNGVSIIIFVGIVSGMPQNIIDTYAFWTKASSEATILFEGLIYFSIYMIAFVFVIFIVTFINEVERKIPIQQTGSGLVENEDNMPYLPLKLNNAGVIPVIFASAIISTPITIAEIIKTTSPDNGFVWFTNNFLSFSSWGGIAIYATTVILFTFLYSQVQINPEKIADNFNKSGTFIPGINPGKDTQKFLSGTINRLSCFGSVFLALIAALPYIIAKLTDLPSNLAIGGTGLIIIISVALQTTQQVKGRLIQQSFIDKKQDKFENGINDSNTSHIW
ncbi:preprotein translocase subunit SecY [Spiroplasma endosymbiont of Othius punctulatus]|uniref:preprotein translocase subunit SecY n=1 Tax=Spiroplasma endosymbiont of Othius punctulatus TaxID=3066289 RepID=UPI0030D07B76